MLLTCRVHLALNKTIVNADRVRGPIRLCFILRNVDQITQAQDDKRQKAKRIAIHSSELDFGQNELTQRSVSSFYCSIFRFSNKK